MIASLFNQNIEDVKIIFLLDMVMIFESGGFEGQRVFNQNFGFRLHL